MKRTTIFLALGLAACSASTTEAADWNNGAGGIKDHGGMAGVPVPAPIPVMESFGWYVRGDIGYAVKSSGSSTTTTALGLSESHPYDPNDGPFHGGIGFGRYLTPGLRMDVTGDYRGAQKVHSGVTYYNGTTITDGPDVASSRIDPITGAATGFTAKSSQINTFAIARSEEVRVANHSALVNLYYDFNRGGHFSPYVGAGLGLTIREGTVEYSEKGNCVFTQNSFDVPPGPQPCALPPYNKSGKPTSVNFALGAAAMTGFTYQIRPGVLIDTGYRLSWQGGNTTIRPTGTGDVISSGTRTDHEIRTGLRFNVW